MKNTILNLFTLLIMFSFAMKSTAQLKKDDVSMFPKAEKGMKQFVIKMPTKPNEENYKIEFYVGQMQIVDVCNSHSLNGEMKSEDLQGWGYQYYTYTPNSAGSISTLRACLDNKMVNKFIVSQPTMLRYNSHLPIVVYVPEGYEVRYKIWTIGKTELKATTGK